MGGVWDEFWIFYKPWVIDNDNYITIYIDDEVLVAGEVGSLFEKTCDPGYERDDVKEILGIDLTPQEVMEKINCKVSHPFEWDEEIAETIGDKEEFPYSPSADAEKPFVVEKYIKINGTKWNPTDALTKIKSNEGGVVLFPSWLEY